MLLILLLALTSAADNLLETEQYALLSGTLRTYQVAGCEGQVVGLSCPPGTSISVREARYGSSATAARTLCPVKSNFPSHIAPPNICQIPSSMQYSLLQTVVEACQKKRQCKIQTSAKPFGTDPCPGVSKYVEVAYKCRPYEFRSKVACENDVVQLKCNPNSRVAVYSASYGRTEYESVQCPQPQGVPEETCLVSYATETVMHICHGKRQCTLSADAATFGNPCRKESRMYLKVVYTCVPRKVLREQYEERPEADESLNEPEPPDFDSYDGLDESVYQDMFSPSPNLGRSNTSGSGSQGPSRRPQQPQPTPPSPHSALPDSGVTWIVDNELQGDADSEPDDPSRIYNSYPGGLDTNHEQDEDVQHINCTVNLYTLKESRVMGFITDWIRVHHFLSNNKERLYLYLVLSVGGGIVCLLALITARLLWQKHTAKRRDSTKFDPQGSITLGTTSLSPDGFMDTISEVDADIDLTTINATVNVIQSPPPPAHKNAAGSVVRFGSGKNGTGNASGAGGQPTHYYYG